MNFTRESIFISALRGFLKSIGVVLGIGIALFILAIGVNAVSNNLEQPDKSTMTLSADANWNRKMLPDTAPVILRIDVHGVIGVGEMKGEKFKDMLLDSREGILSGNRVKGILLHVNTPGGSATDSAAIYEMLQDYKARFKVPVYAFVQGMCASGGMYISCSADQIFATEDSAIGSVGVRLGPTFNFSETMEKVGVKAKTFTEGKDKDMLNPFRPWKSDEGNSIQAILAADYEQFVDVVVANRKRLEKDKLINEYGAHVFPAMKAQELGYIDQGKATYNGALSALVTAAGIKDGTKYQVIKMEPYQSVLKSLSEKQSILRGKLEHVFPIAPHINTELSGKILYLYQP